MHKGTVVRVGKVGCYILLPVLFSLIPTTWIEAHPPFCLSRLLFKRRCPGCGMTRAASCAINGNLHAAWRYNPLFIVVLPLLSYSWLRGLITAWRSLLG
ncbi:DUF2752 domain-containing protein [Ktedonospora formicarum]|uniref:DUF2752 domain-containing protein n=1 Tax=Ktedonospora formicarum TaxID=2778364 RepID=A0A8J3MPH0_9CHLR|nr:DUF2752 domain-containing protein [Ktedonospora formicarum]GHO43812.1 hypothetical protein KSX_19750 [Ktedonospora formicarum]